MFIPRRAAAELNEAVKRFPATCLLGPRQVGKTTLAHTLAAQHPGSIYLDLERPADARRLDDADAYLRSHLGHLVVLDEVHRAPDLFAVLRGVIDEARRQGHRAGQFLLLGSASPALMGMASESLAGRLTSVELVPIDPLEASTSGIDWRTTWLRGGFPDSLLAQDDASSIAWRQAFIRTYLEREVPMFAPRIPSTTLGRLWQMVAHNSGGMLNSSTLASGLGISSPTVTRYIDLLEDLGLVRCVTPWHGNIGKRLVKRPKVFVRDTGLLHALLGIDAMEALLGHPVVGPSFETLVVESAINIVGSVYSPHFYRTSAGAEIDLVLARGGRPEIAIEIKHSSAPVPSAGFHRAVSDLGISRSYVVYPGTESYPLKGGALALPLTMLDEIASA